LIESRYWKEELMRIARSLRPSPKPRRWTERSHCIVERDIMIGFFIVRRLVELTKVSRKVRDLSMHVYSAPSHGKRVTLLNRGDLEELYDIPNERKQTKKPLYLSNQFIHAYTSFVTRDEDRNWESIFVVSDYDRNDCIWRVPISEIRALFMSAARDHVYSASFTYNETRGDYDISPA
jgi:hypothetical protein